MMKKDIMLLFIGLLLLFLVGCVSLPAEENQLVEDHTIRIRSEENESNDQKEYVDMTDEEIEFLCNRYFNEERIRQGKLYSNQKATLEQYRGVKNHLATTYPEEEFILASLEPVERYGSNGQGYALFHKKNESDTNGYVEVQIKITDGQYVYSDNVDKKNKIGEYK